MRLHVKELGSRETLCGLVMVTDYVYGNPVQGITIAKKSKLPENCCKNCAKVFKSRVKKLKGIKCNTESSCPSNSQEPTT